MTVNSQHNSGLNNIIDNFKKLDTNGDNFLDKKEMNAAKEKLSPEGKKYIEALLDNNGKLFQQISNVEHEDKGIFTDSNIKDKVSLADLHTTKRGSAVNEGQGKGFNGKTLDDDNLESLKNTENGVSKKLGNDKKNMQRQAMKKIKEVKEYFIDKKNGKTLPNSSNLRSILLAVTDRKNPDAGSYPITTERSSSFLKQLDTALTILGYPSAYVNTDENTPTQEQVDAIKDSLQSFLESQGIESDVKNFDYPTWKALAKGLNKASKGNSIKFSDKNNQKEASKLLNYFSDKGTKGVTAGKLYPPHKTMRPLYLSVVSPNHKDTGSLDLWKHQSEVKDTMEVLGYPVKSNDIESIKTSIRLYQKEKGLPSVGHIGPGTWKTMVTDLHQIANPGQKPPETTN